MTTTSTLVYIDTLSCYSCGVPFGMSRDFYQQRLEDQKSFYCPAGHSQRFVGKTDADKQRERADAAERKLSWRTEERDAARQLAREADYRARAYKGQITKARKRVGNGVCPCCNRTFEQLAAHMADKHPDYAATAP